MYIYIYIYPDYIYIYIYKYIYIYIYIYVARNLMLLKKKAVAPPCPNHIKKKNTKASQPTGAAWSWTRMERLANARNWSKPVESSWGLALPNTKDDFILVQNNAQNMICSNLKHTLHHKTQWTCNDSNFVQQNSLNDCVAEYEHDTNKCTQMIAVVSIHSNIGEPTKFIDRRNLLCWQMGWTQEGLKHFPKGRNCLTMFELFYSAGL